MSELNDGHADCWEHLSKENQKSEAEEREEYQGFLKRAEAYHRNAHPSCNCQLCDAEKVESAAAFRKVDGAFSGYAFVEGTKIPEGKTTSSSDLINYPPHYTQKGIDTREFIDAKGLTYLEGNVVKYIVRARFKGDYIGDLEKAKNYIEYMIEKAKKSGVKIVKPANEEARNGKPKTP